MSRLTRDGTAEPVSRDQILRHARGQGNVHFPCSADHEQDWQPYPVDPYSAICDDHTYEDCLLRKIFEFLRLFVRGTPTTHSEGLLLRVGALPCAPTYNRGVVQHVVFNRLGLAQPHECSSKAAIYHANSSATSYNNLYRGRNCCTTHASKATYRYFLGTRLRLPRRVTLERVPTDWYFLFSACGVDMLPPRPSPLRHRPSPLRHSHPVGIEILF